MSDFEYTVLSYSIVFVIGYSFGHKTGKRLGSRQGYAAGRGSKECFVATAATGSSDAPEVRTLRRFRDEVLLSSNTGTRAAYYYYRFGPTLARYIEKRPLVRRIVFVIIVKPISALAEGMLKRN
jgi:hypothetical protein